MQWFQIKEQSAGKKRLILTWLLYKTFGKKILYIIAFLVAFFTFIFASDIRSYAKKYFMVSNPYLNIKPTLFNQFKLIYSYAQSLADKILVYCGDFNSENVIFENKENEKELFEHIKNKKGAFFICNHIGNVEIFQSHFLKDKKGFNFNININIFMSHKQSQIFNGFLEKIKKDYPIKLFPVEEIGINTGLELKENLNKGDIVFIAGDRISQKNNIKNIKIKMFNKDIFLPKGTFKLAKLMDAPTYFISVIKKEGKYRIYMERQNDLSEQNITRNFIKFMERIIKINPFQFFNFYDFFN